MQNVQIIAKLTTPGNQMIVETMGTYSEETGIIQYQETDEEATKMTFYLKEGKLGRDNENISMEYEFIEGMETKNKIEIKELEQTLLVSIKTISFVMKERMVTITYQIIDANEECTYELQF